MGRLKQWASLLAVMLAAGTAGTSSAQRGARAEAPVLQLYTLDCGLTEFTDAAYFSDTGEYDGKSLALPTPCFLIRHGSDWLLWDTGNGDKLAALPNGVTSFGGRFTVKHTLVSQLASLGLKPADIRFVALSHLHQDHTGNIGLFPSATFLVSKKELAWALSKPTPFGVNLPTVTPLATAKVEATDNDKDVFGDGSVRILNAPGHTPGHRMLLIDLPRRGSVLITGDLYHTRLNYERGLVPNVNLSRADTLASIARFKALEANKRARVIVQHDPKDFAAMPALPSYLD